MFKKNPATSLGASSWDAPEVPLPLWTAPDFLFLFILHGGHLALQSYLLLFGYRESPHALSNNILKHICCFLLTDGLIIYVTGKCYLFRPSTISPIESES